MAEERAIAKNVIDRLNRKPRFLKRFAFRAMLYEDYTPGMVGVDPQELVEKYMTSPHVCEIFVCILWNRMGTPLINRVTGERYNSGTEYEFKDAYKSHQATQSPIILLYRSAKQTPSAVTIDADQLKLVNDFFESFEGIQASYRGLYRKFASNDEFERFLTDDIEQILYMYFEGEASATEGKLDWPVLDQTIRTFTEQMLGIRYREKYNPDYYARRPDIVGYFEDFLAGDRTVMVLTGKAGTGKSSFVSDISARPLENTVVWLQDCAVLHLAGEMQIDDYIHRQLKLPENLSLQLAFDKLEAENPTRKIILLFDAVNEFSEPAELLRKLSSFVISIHAKSVKVLMTCRVPQWNNLSRYLQVPSAREFLIAGKGSSVSTDVFGDDEIAGIYERYRKFFDISTPYADLAPSVREFIVEPLFLKFI